MGFLLLLFVVKNEPQIKRIVTDKNGFLLLLWQYNGTRMKRIVTDLYSSESNKKYRKFADFKLLFKKCESAVFFFIRDNLFDPFQSVGKERAKKGTHRG